MCGFGGVINNHSALHEKEVGLIASRVSFRGPDNCGVRILDNDFHQTTQGNTALFFNRLAIIDLDSRSNQPFEDEENILMFNGEIYNYNDLKLSLQKAGIYFRTSSDTEVLFYALKLWGKEALPKLNGMFAFFWLDKKNRSFLVARDRVGIKPLYYHYNSGSFYFGSELNSIIRLLNKRPAISNDAIDMYLWMQFVPTPYSILDRVFKLAPGSFIETPIDDIKNKPQPIPFWNAYEEVSRESVESDDLETLLKDSIARQLQADVPLGLFLSSGVDSSLLAALVNKYFTADKDVNFFTVSFNEQTDTDESADASDFIRGFNNPHLKNCLLNVNADYLQNRLGQLYDYYDEPFGDYASLLNWAISAKAREYVTVAISGDGADELFWGYSRYNKWQDIEKLNTSPFVSKTISAVAMAMPTLARIKMQRAFRHDPVERNFDQFLQPAFRTHFKDSITQRGLWALEGIEGIKNRKDLPAVVDIKTYLADGMLYKVDRSSMASSLEVRVPYLDNTILDYALRLPLNKKSNHLFRNKAILKELLVQLAPHFNVNQPKKGFSFPLKKWLRENWKEQVCDMVNSRTLADLGLEPKEFLPVLRQLYEKDQNTSVEVWYLFNLALWKNHYDNVLK